MHVVLGPAVKLDPLHEARDEDLFVEQAVRRVAGVLPDCSCVTAGSSIRSKLVSGSSAARLSRIPGVSSRER
jgi:hypothetical protein